jgi:hypothetical protein
MRPCPRLTATSSYLLVVLFLSTLPCTCQPRAGSRQTTLKEVLSWLPDDTETVIGENGPFALPDFDGLDGNRSERPELQLGELEARLRVLPLGLFGLRNGGLQQRLKGKAVTLAVEGARHFRQPAVLGNMLYEGCGIAVYDPAITLDRDSFMRNAATTAVRFENMEGVRIAVFEEPEENDVWTTFVGFPRSNIVVIATNADYLRAVLLRMFGASGPRALPETLREWKYVNTRAPVWGLRHYQRLEAGLDPTSPFSGDDDMAVGLAFWFAPAVRRMATVTYLSSNENASQIVQDNLSMADAKSASPLEFQIRFRRPAPGVIEGTLTLTLKEGLYRFLFGLVLMLGHAVLV